MNEDLLNKILKFINPNTEINLIGIPATQFEIEAAEKELNITFHEDYIIFIKKFGGSYAGIPIYAFKNNEMLSEDTVIDLTKNFRADYEGDNRSEIINKSYVFSFDGSGNPIMINQKGEVIIFYHDNDQYKILADSLSKLIEDILEGKLENEF